MARRPRRSPPGKLIGRLRWDLEWADLPEDVRNTCLLLARRGDPPAVLKRHVDLYPAAERIWEAYWEIDRSEWGVPLTTGMREVLDEYGWTNPQERRAIRKLWRLMYSEEHADREAKRKAAKNKKKKPGREGSSDDGVEDLAEE